MKKISIVFVFIVLVAGAALLANQRLQQKPAPEIRQGTARPSAPTQETTLRRKSDQTAAYRNEEYGFEFSHPRSVNIRDFTSRPVTNFDREKINLYVSAERIRSVSQADGPCGTASPKAYEQQKSAFDQVEPGESFTAGFRMTNYGVAQSQVLVNPQGVKLVYGIDICQGLTGEEDLGSFDYTALAFKDDTRVSLRIPLTKEQSGNIKVKDLEAQAKRIAEGTAEDQAEAIFNDFLSILNSVQFSHNGS